MKKEISKINTSFIEKKDSINLIFLLQITISSLDASISFHREIVNHIDENNISKEIKSQLFFETILQKPYGTQYCNEIFQILINQISFIINSKGKIEEGLNINDQTIVSCLLTMLRIHLYIYYKGQKYLGKNLEPLDEKLFNLLKMVIANIKENKAESYFKEEMLFYFSSEMVSINQYIEKCNSFFVNKNEIKSMPVTVPLTFDNLYHLKNIYFKMLRTKGESKNFEMFFNLINYLYSKNIYDKMFEDQIENDNVTTDIRNYTINIINFFICQDDAEHEYSNKMKLLFWVFENWLFK